MGYENTLPFIRNYRVVILGSESESLTSASCERAFLVARPHRTGRIARTQDSAMATYGYEDLMRSVLVCQVVESANPP